MRAERFLGEMRVAQSIYCELERSEYDDLRRRRRCFSVPFNPWSKAVSPGVVRRRVRREGVSKWVWCINCEHPQMTVGDAGGGDDDDDDDDSDDSDDSDGSSSGVNEDACAACDR